MTPDADPFAPRRTGGDARRLRAVGPPPIADGMVDAGDDSIRLLVLLGLFTAAVLIVVGALLGAATIDSWWALVALLLVHAAMTGASFAGVAYVFSGRLRSAPKH